MKSHAGFSLRNRVNESLLQKDRRVEKRKKGNVSYKDLKKELQKTQNAATSVRWGENCSAPVMQLNTFQNFMQLMCSWV